MMTLVVYGKNGRVAEGDTVTSHRGETAKLVRATRAREQGRSGLVVVAWDKDYEHQRKIGRTHYAALRMASAEYYDNVFGLRVEEEE
jgi:hypothetical protein